MTQLTTRTCKVCGYTGFAEEIQNGIIVHTCLECFVSKTPDEWVNLSDEEIDSFREIVKKQEYLKDFFSSLSDEEYDRILELQKIKKEFLLQRQAIQNILEWRYKRD